MTLNRVKRGRTVTVMEYLDSVVPLRFQPKTVIWSKTTVHVSNLPNLAELVVNHFAKSISKKN